MGKSKKRSRASKSRLNPLGGNKKNLLSSEAKDNATITKRIQPLIKQLQSAVVNDRHMALSSICVLCEDDHMRKLLLREKLVPIILSKLLNDDNTEIIVEAYGLLRNLALEEGYDVSTHLWRSNIWVSIMDGFSKIEKSLNSMSSESDKSSTESKRMLFDFIDNLISLVVALANGSDKILTDILDTDKIQNIFKLLAFLIQFGVDKIPISLFNTILDLIYDFSSESFQFIELISNDNFLSNFIIELPNFTKNNNTHSNELTLILIQGIYIQFLDSNLQVQNLDTIIHDICNTINNIDIKQLQIDLFASAALIDENHSTIDKELMETKDTKTVTEKIKDYTKKRSESLMKLQSLEIAIDLITAVIEMFAAFYEEENSKRSQNIELPDELIITFAEFLPHVFNTLSEFFTSRILIAWNNLLWLYLTIGINIFDLTTEPYKPLWAFLKSDTLDNNDLSIKIGKASVIWALLKTITMQQEQVPILEIFQLYNNSQFVKSYIKEYEASLITADNKEENLEYRQRCCGVLATYALFQKQVGINREIGQFFLNLITDEKIDPILLVDIITYLFEIYPDSNYDYDEPVFVNDNFLNILKEEVLPNAKKIFKLVDRNANPEFKEGCTDCFTNLNKFIQYKEQER